MVRAGDQCRREKSLHWREYDKTAGEGIRTLDIHVGNVTLYQLSYARDGDGLMLAIWRRRIKPA